MLNLCQPLATNLPHLVKEFSEARWFAKKHCLCKVTMKIIESNQDSLSLLADVALVYANFPTKNINQNANANFIVPFGHSTNTATFDYKQERHFPVTLTVYPSGQPLPVVTQYKTSSEEPLNLSVVKHQLSFQKDSSFPCLQCDRSYSTASNLARHR